MSEKGEQRQFPKAVIHKRILELASTHPEASVEELADEVSGATLDLVERVLEEYGDPGDEHSGTATSSTEAMPENTKYDSPDLAREEDRTAPQAVEYREETESTDRAPDDGGMQHTESDTDSQLQQSDTFGIGSESFELDALSTNQQDVLQAIHQHPDVTQRELAKQFDVSPATISRWVNEIPGFEWENRQQLVAHHFEATETASDGGTPSDGMAEQHANGTDPRLGELEDELATLHDRIDTLEQEDESSKASTGASTIDSDIFAKIVRACLADDRITEDEEEAIITTLR